MPSGVILYGHPASGKKTVTQALVGLVREYHQFRRIKCGPGETEGFRMTDAETLNALRRVGGVIWEHEQYGATYAVDRKGLQQAVGGGVPVLHLGQRAGVEAVIAATSEVDWTVAEVFCPQEIAIERLIQRGTTNLFEQITVLRATPHLASATLQIDTSVDTPTEAAKQIHTARISR